ncbi:MAG TPA: FHA domain-containing protein [Woeseiaceae bacterium]|nr:FHA domain-containing protein [Woeseiaceae bacterium]
MNEDAAMAELETLTVRHFRASAGLNAAVPVLESDETTFDIDEGGLDGGAPARRAAPGPRDRTELVERLRFDFEQVRSKWLGVQAELRSREQLTGRLDIELRTVQDALCQANVLIRQRDEAIAGLASRIEARDRERARLDAVIDDLRSAGLRTAERALTTDLPEGSFAEQIARYEGAVAGLKSECDALREQYRRTEAYADDLRRQLADLREESRAAVDERDSLRATFAGARITIAALEARLAEARLAAGTAEGALAAVRDAHEQEMRLLRYELAEAQATLAEQSEVSELLASGLTENRGQRIELERQLTDHEQHSRDRVETLEKQVAYLEKALAENERRLETKSDAISALMAELSRESTSPAAEHVDDAVILGTAPVGRPAERAPGGERTTRLLVGAIDGQEVRFPLFKDRVTIGRTPRNDIHLAAEFVSRRHAMMLSDGNATRIVDRDSKNGVYVNSRRVTEHTLTAGDRVLIGSVEFRYEELPRRDNG